MVKSNSIYQILEADMAKENRNRFAEGRVNHAHITIFPRLCFFFAFYKNGDNDFKKWYVTWKVTRGHPTGDQSTMIGYKQRIQMQRKTPIVVL